MGFLCFAFVPITEFRKKGKSEQKICHHEMQKKKAEIIKKKQEQHYDGSCDSMS